MENPAESLPVRTALLRKSIPEWLVIVSVYLTLTMLVWGLFALDRGMWQDEVPLLEGIRSSSGFQAQLFTPIASPTRVLGGTVFALAIWTGSPVIVLQLLFGLTWLMSGVLAHLLVAQLFPQRAWLTYIVGALTLSATGDFATNYLGALSLFISVAFYFASVICLLMWWQGRGQRWLWAAGIFLSFSVWMYDAALAAILLTPGLFWILDGFCLTWRLIKLVVFWYVLITPYLIVLTNFLIDPVSYAGAALMPMTLSERVQRTLLLFSHNFTPWMWGGLYPRRGLSVLQSVLPSSLHFTLAVVGVLAFLGGALWLWYKHPETDDRFPQENRLFVSLGAISLLMALASNASYASVSHSGVFFRTQLVSRIWTSLAVALLAYGLGVFALRRPYLALILPSLFVGFGVYGGLERQDFYLSYWQRHQTELRSIVEQVHGLQPSAHLILYVPPGTPYLATEAPYLARAWLGYLYGDSSLAERTFLWSRKQNTNCIAEKDGFVCQDETGQTCHNSAPCEPETLPYTRTVLLSYSLGTNRYVLLDRIPPYLLGNKTSSQSKTYNPSRLFVRRSLPDYAQDLLYGPQYLGALLPRISSPPDYSLISITSSISAVVTVEDLYIYPPWGIEVYNGHSLLWLGQGNQYGLGGSLRATEKQMIQAIFEVEPGPARPDSQRTVELTLTNAAGTQTARQQFDQATPLTFTGELQPGRSDFSFIVLDEPTILQQPNGDTRPLLVLLRQINIKPLAVP